MGDAYDFWADRLSTERRMMVDAFWQRFAIVAPVIDEALDGFAPDIDPDQRIKAALGSLDELLFWDIEPGETGKRRLVVTAERHHARRPLARAAVRRAPKIKGWEVSDARNPRVAIPKAVEAILIRSRSEAIAIEELRPVAGAHRLVELIAYGQGEREFLADQAGVIFAVLLGDLADQIWLGDTIGVVRGRMVDLRRAILGREPRSDHWLSDFREAALSVISRFEGHRPERPAAATPLSGARLRTLKRRPVEGDPARRRDATRYRTRYDALVAARFAGVPIASLRFSRFGESFCGLKIALAGAPTLARDDRLDDLAGLLEAALKADGTGGITGCGHGLAHVYIDLALADLEGAVGLIRSVLSEQRMTGPAWMIFDEAGLGAYYLPVTPNTPPTPIAL